MASDRQLAFFLLRYVPDAVKGEFVNIGVVLVGAAKDADYGEVRLTTDWRRVRCLDPDFDIELLEALEREVRVQLASTHDRDRLLRRLQDSFSNAIQVSEVKAFLGEEPQEEIEKLARTYLERSWPAKQRRRSGRQRILSVMRTAFEQAGVWGLMDREIPASQYTHKGDPLTIDCAYQPNGTLHMFQAVTLAGNVDAAKVLAFSYPELSRGIERVKQAKASLTAVVEGNLDANREEIDFALATMKSSGILVAYTTEMPAIADEARKLLRV